MKCRFIIISYNAEGTLTLPHQRLDGLPNRNSFGALTYVGILPPVNAERISNSPLLRHP